jgi:hypothetical protein
MASRFSRPGGHRPPRVNSTFTGRLLALSLAGAVGLCEPAAAQSPAEEAKAQAARAAQRIQALQREADQLAAEARTARRRRRRFAPCTKERRPLPRRSQDLERSSSSTTAPAPTRSTGISPRRSSPRALRSNAGAWSVAWATRRRGHRPLYFELRIDGRPVDPVQWLRR